MLARGLALASALALAATGASAQLGFRITSPELTECGAAQIEWQGGTPPLYLTAVPAYHTATNISIPTQTQNTTGGKTSFPVPYPAGTKVTFILSDDTGFAVGGVSPQYTVGALKHGDVCDVVTSNPPFQFDMAPSPEYVNQCENVEFLWDTSLTSGGVFVTGVIPSGEVIQWFDGAGHGRTGWTVNMAKGTQIVFAVWDASGKQGGTSNTFTVGDGAGDCLNMPYSSTPVWAPTPVGKGPSATASHRAGVVTVTAITITRPQSAADLSGGAIAGIVVGVVVVVLIAQALIVWFCCRRQLSNFLENRRQQRERKRNPDVDLFEANGTGMTSLGSRSTGRHSRLPDSGDHQNPFDDRAGTVSPFVGGSDCPSPISPVSPMNHTHNSSHFLTTQGSSSNISGDSERSALASAGGLSVRVPSKAQMAATNPDEGSVSPMFSDLPSPLTPRGGFRRHEDAGRINVPPPSSEVEDLPPNYNPEWERDRS